MASDRQKTLVAQPEVIMTYIAMKDMREQLKTEFQNKLPNYWPSMTGHVDTHIVAVPGVRAKRKGYKKMGRLKEKLLNCGC